MSVSKDGIASSVMDRVLSELPMHLRRSYECAMSKAMCIARDKRGVHAISFTDDELEAFATVEHELEGMKNPGKSVRRPKRTRSPRLA